jgi:DoxX-like family
MTQRITYWATTGLLAADALFVAILYLSGNAQVVNAFVHLGYPQQLRFLLGIAKFLGAIALIMPGVPRLKEWAYAGFTFAWIAASIAHYIAGDRAESVLAVVLLVMLWFSYATRPATRTWITAEAA